MRKAGQLRTRIALEAILQGEDQSRIGAASSAAKEGVEGHDGYG